MDKKKVKFDGQIPEELVSRLEAEIEKELEADIESLKIASANMTLSQIEVRALKIRQRFGERLMERILQEQKGGKLQEKKM
jgi:hypothetical protein